MNEQEMKNKIEDFYREVDLEVIPEAISDMLNVHSEPLCIYPILRKSHVEKHQGSSKLSIDISCCKNLIEFEELSTLGIFFDECILSGFINFYDCDKDGNDVDDLIIKGKVNLYGYKNDLKTYINLKVTLGYISYKENKLVFTPNKDITKRLNNNQKDDYAY